MGLGDIAEALFLGAKNTISTAVVLLCSGIVVGIVLLTGMGTIFSIVAMDLAGGHLFVMILLVALASLILGMGLPVTASYIVLAVLVAPAMQMMGVSLIAAHMLIFWYSQDANVTPPVCLAAYTAAGIAGSKPLQTGLEAWKLAKGLYLIPLLFCYTPILFEGPVWLVAEAATSGMIGLFSFAILSEGFFFRAINWPLRLMFGAVTVLMFWPGYKTNLARFHSFRGISAFWLWRVDAGNAAGYPLYCRRNIEKICRLHRRLPHPRYPFRRRRSASISNRWPDWSASWPTSASTASPSSGCSGKPTGCSMPNAGR